MSGEKILVSFVYQEGSNFVLIVPDLGNEVMIRAKSQSEVIRKAIRILRSEYQKIISTLTPTTIEQITDKYKKQKAIPKSAILYPLPIKIGQRERKFKRFTSSMDESILDLIENFTKQRKIKKSDFFTQASMEYIQKYDRQGV